MTTISRELLEREIERLRRRHAALLEAAQRPEPAAAVWELVERTLCWHVVLRDALEPDVDVEVLADVLVVRAAREAPAAGLRVAVLPVPAPFRAAEAIFEFRSGVLEIRLAVSGSA